MENEDTKLLEIANRRLRRIRAILTDSAVEIKSESGAVLRYEAHLDEEEFRTLMNLCSGLGHDDN